MKSFFPFLIASLLQLSATPGADPVFPDLAERIVKPDSRHFAAVAIADFDGNGRPDLAGPLKHFDLAIGLQDEIGWTWKSWSTGIHDQEVGRTATGDFDGDGLPDIAAAIGGTFVIYYGTLSEGLVIGPDIFSSIGFMTCHVTGDFDGDGFCDLAAIVREVDEHSVWHQSLVVYLGRPDRELEDLPGHAFEAATLDMAARDLDGDGVLDLAILEGSDDSDLRRLTVLRGRSDGTFEDLSKADLEGRPTSLAIGDLRGDGKAGLVLPCPEEGLVRFLVGMGDGTFASIGGGFAFAPEAVACADLGGDQGDEVLVLEGDGTLGIYTPGSGLPLARMGKYLGGGGLALPIADMDGDGHLDVVLHDDKGLVLLRGRGDGTLIAPEARAAYSPELAAGGFSLELVFRPCQGDLAAEDIDGDRIPDLLWLRGTPEGGIEMAVALGKGDGTFEPEKEFQVGGGPASSSSRFVLADLDGDEMKDVLFADFGDQFPPRAGSLAVFLNIGGGLFAETGNYPAGEHPIGIATGRIDGDPFEDVVVDAWGGLLTVFFGDIGGTLMPGPTFEVERGLCQPFIGDFDGDGGADIAFTSPGKPSLDVLFGDGAGGFERVSFDSPSSAFQIPILAADRSGPVPVLLIPDSGGVCRFRLTGRELSLIDRPVVREFIFESAALADLDGDGAKDVILAGWEEMEIFFSGGWAPLASPAPIGSRAVVAADLDGDGAEDIVTMGGAIIVHLSRLAVPFIRGDAAPDGKIDLSDPIGILEHLFLGVADPGPTCLEAWNPNGDGAIDIADPIYLLLYQFSSGEAPPAPFPGCGTASGGLGCGSHIPCR
jgi:hypothetical protein